jgi:hypothetical protein
VENVMTNNEKHEDGSAPHESETVLLELNGTEQAAADSAEPFENLGPDAPVDIAAASMHGDLVSALLDEVKSLPKPWQQLSESQQDAVIDRLRRRTGEAIDQCVRAIAADGRDTCVAELEQLTSKDGIKAVLKLSAHDENRYALLDAVGKQVLVVVGDSKHFLAGEMPRAEPTQMPLAGVDTQPDASANDTPVADNCPATAEAA